MSDNRIEDREHKEREPNADELRLARRIAAAHDLPLARALELLREWW